MSVVISSHSSTHPTITGLYIYPIKSCAGIAVNAMPLDALGAVNDRRYMLVDEQGQFITQRHDARLVYVGVEEHQQGWLISLPGVGAMVLPLQGAIQREAIQRETSQKAARQHIMMVNVWSDTFAAYDQGDEWADFFSSYIGKKVRLVFSHLDTERRIDPHYCKTARPVSFADGFPLLLTNESSLALLNDKLETPVNMLRFRPNIVVNGAAAFAENHWQNLHAATLELAVVKPCSRCVIPTINPQTAQKEPAVWKALELLCKAGDGKVYFGQNVIHHSAGILHVGEALLPD